MSTTVTRATAEGGARGKPRHPAGLYILFATEMWERFGFYTILAVLTLYLQRGGFGWSKQDATRLYSTYQMFIYATPLVGGFIADRFFGYRNSVLLGGACFFAGYGLLGLGREPIFYAAISLIFVGNGFLKPNISTMVGNLYPAGSPLRDSAYNIFYMGINVGATLGPLVAEFGCVRLIAGREVSELAKAGATLTAEQSASLRSAYLTAFLVSSAGLLFGTLLFSAFYRRMAAVEKAHTLADAPADEVAVTEDLPPAHERPASALEQVPEWRRITALVVVYAIVIVFWMVFHQNGTTMTYWADANTDWEYTGTVSNAINPIWVILLSLPLVKFWSWLNAKGLEPSTPTKMAIGMLFTSLAFVILYAAARSGGDQTFLTDPSGNYLVETKGKDEVFKVVENKVSPVWLIVAFASISLGELMLSPMGLSLVSKVAPVRMRGLMMGGWFLATAIGNKLTIIGVYWDRWYHSSFWLLCASLALGMAFVLILLLRPLKRAMPGV